MKKLFSSRFFNTYIIPSSLAYSISYYVLMQGILNTLANMVVYKAAIYLNWSLNHVSRMLYSIILVMYRHARYKIRPFWVKNSPCLRLPFVIKCTVSMISLPLEKNITNTYTHSPHLSRTHSPRLSRRKRANLINGKANSLFSV